MWQVWLVWMHKFLKRVEDFERYVIFSWSYSLILLIKWFLFCCVHLLFRFILWTVLLRIFILFNLFCLNPDCSFIFEWRNLLGIWNDAQIFVFAECTFVSIQFLLLKMWSSLLTCIEQWWWRSSVAAIVLQLYFNQLWDRMCLMLLSCWDWQRVKYCFGR